MHHPSAVAALSLLFFCCSIKAGLAVNPSGQNDNPKEITTPNPGKTPGQNENQGEVVAPEFGAEVPKPTPRPARTSTPHPFSQDIMIPMYPSPTPRQSRRPWAKDISVRGREWNQHLAQAAISNSLLSADEIFYQFWSKYPAKFTGRVAWGINGSHFATISSMPNCLAMFSVERWGPSVKPGDVVEVVGRNHMFYSTPRRIALDVEKYNYFAWDRGFVSRRSSVIALFSDAEVTILRRQE